MPKEVTDADIEALRDEAAAAGDDDQVAVCDVALGSRSVARRRYATKIVRVRTGVRDACRRECERVILAARSAQ